MTDPDETVGVVASGVGRSFGTVHAVRDASFVAEPGKVTGLIGPNGSGKTTLLLMLATLLVPDRGVIRIGGRDPVHESKAVRSVMGWMPDVLGSWPTLTVRETLQLTGRMYGFDTARARVRAEELIHLVDLADLAPRATRVLSRGQKQRLSLARSLVHDPRVLLLDEPASGLDPGARVALRKLDASPRRRGSHDRRLEPRARRARRDGRHRRLPRRGRDRERGRGSRPRRRAPAPGASARSLPTPCARRS